jgi:hypothetical protein
VLAFFFFLIFWVCLFVCFEAESWHHHGLQLMEAAAVILTSGYYHGVGAAAGNRDSSRMWVMVRRQRLCAPSNG